MAKLKTRGLPANAGMPELKEWMNELAQLKAVNSRAWAWEASRKKETQLPELGMLLDLFASLISISTAYDRMFPRL